MYWACLGKRANLGCYRGGRLTSSSVQETMTLLPETHNPLGYWSLGMSSQPMWFTLDWCALRAECLSVSEWCFRALKKNPRAHLSADLVSAAQQCCFNVNELKLKDNGRIEVQLTDAETKWFSLMRRRLNPAWASSVLLNVYVLTRRHMLKLLSGLSGHVSSLFYREDLEKFLLGA